MKTICIYHSRDLDGWMSAAIVKKWWEDENPAGKIFTSPYLDHTTVEKEKLIPDTLTFFGWDYGDEIPNTSKYDRVIMCDISFPTSIMVDQYDRLDDNFIWIDHHVSAIKPIVELVEKKHISLFNGLIDTSFAACELTWKYFFPEQTMPEIVRLLGRYDCFGHKGTDEEQKVLEFQYAARAIMSNYVECHSLLTRHISASKGAMLSHDVSIEGILKLGEGIYKYLCTEAKQTYSKAFPVTFDEPVAYGPGGLHDIGTFLCVNQERFNPINFGIDYHKEGYAGFACFWFKDGKWSFSLYNDNGQVDCSAIAKCFGGGEHKGAAGFVVDDLKKIIGSS